MAVFFIDAEHSSMLGRAKIESDDVGCLALKLRIIAGHIAFQPVRLQASLFPDAMHGVLTDIQRRRQFAATPVRGAIDRLPSRGGPAEQMSARLRPVPDGMCLDHRARVEESAASNE